MHSEQRQSAHELLRSREVPRALFASTDSVAWLTGFAPPLQLGPPLFAGGPPLVWYEDGQFTLVVVDSFAPDLVELDREPDCAVVSYLGYSFSQPPAGPQDLVRALDQVLGGARGAGGRVGIEARQVPFGLVPMVLDLLEVIEAVPLDGWLEPLRIAKTDRELGLLRENFGLADIGQAAARRAVSAGKREIDVWTEAHSAIQQAAGQRVPLGNDCVVGHRQTNFTGWPLDHEIGRDDSIIVDLGTGLHGYWSDGCATYFASEPTPKQVAMHRTATEALELALSLIRPGVKVRQIDQAVRQLISRAGYPEPPHHTGHGVGVSRYEAPRIVPYSDEVLAEGMVIMLEPGVYLPGVTGVRLEDGVLVTADGAEILTKHDKSLR